MRNGLVDRNNVELAAFVDFSESDVGSWPVVSNTLSCSIGMLMTEFMERNC